MREHPLPIFFKSKQSSIVRERPATEAKRVGVQIVCLAYCSPAHMHDKGVRLKTGTRHLKTITVMCAAFRLQNIGITLNVVGHPPAIGVKLCLRHNGVLRLHKRAVGMRRNSTPKSKQSTHSFIRGSQQGSASRSCFPTDVSRRPELAPADSLPYCSRESFSWMGWCLILDSQSF